MPPKATSGSLAPKSPPKSRRSTRKRAQSSVDTTIQPPAKKLAKGDVEEGDGSGDEVGTRKKGKAIRYVN
jgi:hypothetical protein